MEHTHSVRWPAGHEPLGAALHEVNTCRSSADPDAICAWLVRPDHWREFYGNALRVRHRAGPWPELALGTRFSWITFGAPVNTEITELEAPYRLAWTGSGLGSVGHHGWVLTPTEEGVRFAPRKPSAGSRWVRSHRWRHRSCAASTSAGWRAQRASPSPGDGPEAQTPLLTGSGSGAGAALGAGLSSK